MSYAYASSVGLIVVIGGLVVLIIIFLMLEETGGSVPLAERIFKKSGSVAINGSEEKQYDVSNSQESLKNFFVEPDEKLLGQLGNGYLVNLLFNKARKCNALLTDKRIYLKGTFYSGDNKTLFKTTEERVLDLEDVTGTGFIYKRFSKLMIILSILTVLGVLFIVPRMILIGLIVAICFLLYALKSRKVFFYIDYAGGRIKIDAKLVGLSDVQDFHKQMRRAKDAVTGKK